MRLFAVLLMSLPTSAFAINASCVETAIQVSLDFGQRVDLNEKGSMHEQCKRVKKSYEKVKKLKSDADVEESCLIGVAVGMRHNNMPIEIQDNIFAAIAPNYCK